MIRQRVSQHLHPFVTWVHRRFEAGSRLYTMSVVLAIIALVPNSFGMVSR